MPNLDSIVLEILKLASTRVGSKTFFVSKLMKEKYQIFKVYNNGNVLIEEGQEFFYQQTL